MQIPQLDQDRLAEVLTELRDVDNKLAELAEQKVTAEDQLKRIDILSPQDGIVHELAVHTIGGVSGAGETVMQIVPVNDRLVVKTKIKPADIDQMHVGQQATLRFSAFNQRTTQEVTGHVKTVAADLVNNPQTGEAGIPFASRLSRRSYPNLVASACSQVCRWKPISRPASERRCPISLSR